MHNLGETTEPREDDIFLVYECVCFPHRDSKKLQSLERAISDMIWWRQQLVSDSLTQVELVSNFSLRRVRFSIC